MRALLSVIKADDLAGLEKFLQNGVDIDSPIRYRSVAIPDILQNGPSLICAAAYFSALKCFRYLFLNGADTLFVDDFQRKLVHFASAGGSTEILEIISDNQNIDFSAVDKEGNTPVHYAVMFNRTRMVYYLWAIHHVSLDILNKRNMSPLHIAVTNEEIKMVKFLCENGCNINAKNDIGLTPLHIAACKPNIELIKTLIQKWR
ncbi:ankyrin repeat protein [Histomonas meleagridis]|nr:ankyrin repeat protein [Histomonas meleagridis]